MTKQQKVQRFALVLNSFLFFMGAIAFFEQRNFVLASIQVLAFIVNILLLREHINYRPHSILNPAIHLLNGTVAFFIAMKYIDLGKLYIQYVWFLVVVFSFIAMLVQLKKMK